MQNAWTCAGHGAVAPLHAPVSGTSEHLTRVGSRSLVPLWLPWPLPHGWLVTGTQFAGDDHTGPLATVVACSGPNPLHANGSGGPCDADMIVVAEQMGVGLGASLAGLVEVDAGDSLSGALVAGGPQARIHAAGQVVHLWHVPTAPERAAYVGEALGVWLWLIMWPAAAGAMVVDRLALVDARAPGHALDVPTGAPSPRLEWAPAA